MPISCYEINQTTINICSGDGTCIGLNNWHSKNDGYTWVMTMNSIFAIILMDDDLMFAQVMENVLHLIIVHDYQDLLVIIAVLLQMNFLM